MITVEVVGGEILSIFIHATDKKNAFFYKMIIKYVGFIYINKKNVRGFDLDNRQGQKWLQ